MKYSRKKNQLPTYQGGGTAKPKVDSWDDFKKKFMNRKNNVQNETFLQSRDNITPGTPRTAPMGMPPASNPLTTPNTSNNLLNTPPVETSVGTPNFNLAKPPMNDVTEAPPGFTSQSSSPQEYANSLQGAMLTDEGEQLRSQSAMEPGEMQSDSFPQSTQNPTGIESNPPTQFYNPYGGVELESAGASFGQSLGSGDTLGAVASGLKVALGTARNVLSGYGQERRNKYMRAQYAEKQREGMTGQGRETMLEYGGHFQDGGEQQIIQQASAALQQGANPEQVMQTLVQSGMSQDQAIEIIQSIMEQLQGQESTPQFQIGGQNREIDNTYVKVPRLPLKAIKRELTTAELEALAHQMRGMGTSSGSYVKKAGSVMNDLGNLTPGQQKELEDYMSRSNALETLYQGMPNFGRVLGDGYSAADLPENSKLRNQFQEGGQEQGDPAQEMMVQVSQMLQQGATPEEILQQLVQAGIPEEQATQIVQAALQQMQAQGNQSNPQEEAMEQGQMKTGGEFLEMLKGKTIKDYVLDEKTGKYTVNYE